MAEFMSEIEVSLAAKNGILNELYGKYVKMLFRQQYDIDKVEATNNNYLDDPTNAEHIAERNAMKSYRAECKVTARAFIESCGYYV